jgi:superfamily I DNA/RNA helicase
VIAFAYYQAFDAESEARFVASKILEHRQEQSDLRSAVLYRTNSQSRVFEESMRRAGLVYNIVGGFSFYERIGSARHHCLPQAGIESKRFDCAGARHQQPAARYRQTNARRD